MYFFFFRNLYKIKYLPLFFSPFNSRGSFPPSAVLSLPGSSSLTDVHDESRQKVTKWQTAHKHTVSSLRAGRLIRVVHWFPSQSEANSMKGQQKKKEKEHGNWAQCTGPVQFGCNCPFSSELAMFNAFQILRQSSVRHMSLTFCVTTSSANVCPSPKVSQTFCPPLWQHPAASIAAAIVYNQQELLLLLLHLPLGLIAQFFQSSVEQKLLAPPPSASLSVQEAEWLRNPLKLERAVHDRLARRMRHDISELKSDDPAAM